MDELDLLKKDWNKESQEYPKLSYKDIYKMVHAKSSSIVKWIFIISLLEFVFWTGISFFFKDSSFSDKVDNLDMDHILIPLTVISYGVLLYFFYKFYKNYKNISATDSSKNLMETILKTRRTVKHYVLFNLGALVLGTFAGIGYVLKHDENTISQINQAAANGDIFIYYAGIIIATVILLAIAIGVLLLFYWLVYGILLKRLNRNYKELKKLEV